MSKTEFRRCCFYLNLAGCLEAKAQKQQNAMFTTTTLDELCCSLEKASTSSVEARFSDSSDTSASSSSETLLTPVGLALDIDETLSATNLAWFQRLIKLFGNDPINANRSERSIMEEYHLAQNVPWWKENPKALAWMDEQRKDPSAQDGLPVIEGALEGAQALSSCGRISLVAYITVRPASVNPNTIQWLQELGFPALPVLAKPDSVLFEKGNQWKAECLRRLYPYCKGIVDDNPKLPRSLQAGISYCEKDGDIIHRNCDNNCCSSFYKGRVFMFGQRDPVPDDCNRIGKACATWKDVVKEVRLWSSGIVVGGDC